MRLALATCSNLPTWEVDDRPLHEALVRRSAELHRPAWDDPTIDWAAFDLVLIRTTWDYQEKRDRFVDWAFRTAALTGLCNPAPVVAWNTHKRYLRELQTHGVPIAPTLWLDRGSRPDLGRLLAERGWRRGFLKPCVGATARETLRFEADPPGIQHAQAHAERLLPHEDLMLQPYLPAVESRGEWSAVFFGGAFSHAVRKVPVPGDYRVQDDFGAHDEVYAPSQAERELAERTAALLHDRRGPCPGADGTPLLYARTDFLWDDQGDCVLTELEVVEPSLFFRHAPGAADHLAALVLERAAR